MGKPPAFQMYAADFLADTMSWTTVQVGAYTRLLLYSWVNGPLPNNMAALARIAGCDVRNMHKMWLAELAKKWELTPTNMYVNPRLEFEREKQANYRETQSQKGRRGNEIKWQGHIAGAIPVRSPEDRSSSSSSIIKNKESIHTPEIQEPETPKPKPKKPQLGKIDKDQFLDVVFLTKEEYGKLLVRFGEPVALRAIEILNNAIMSKGYKYKSHYHTILGWPSKEALEGGGNGRTGPYRKDYPKQDHRGTIVDQAFADADAITRRRLAREAASRGPAGISKADNGADL